MNTLKSLLALAAAAWLGATAQAAAQPKLVDSLLESYLEIQTALAGDDLPAAQVGARRYLAAFSEGSASLNLEKLQGEAKKIASAPSLDEARSAFSKLTDQAVSLVQLFGVSQESPLYLASCPMAFQGKGGKWLQNGDTVANPYFGARMLRCGSIQALPDASRQALVHGSADDACDHSADESCPSCSSASPASCQMRCCEK